METAELKVVKRDDSVEDFDIKKIERAIARACQETHDAEGEKNASLVAEKALDEFSGKIKNNSVGIEDIQDGVELALIDTGHKQTALAYARYREKHAQMRNGLNYGKLVDDYLGQNDWRVKENATVNFSLGGLILSNSGAVTANYWLNDIYDKEIADAHRNADLHIHDLSMLSPYCGGWSLKQLINEGLGGVPNKIASTPAGHLSTLCNQMVNFLGCMQNEWAGAQAFSSFDTYLAPFVKKDNLSYKEVKQAIQSFVFGVNTPSRWGCQAPFTNVTIDWTIPDDLKNLPAVVGGKMQDFTYGDCQKEADMVNKAFIEVMIEGDANGRGFQYPIPTYSITKDFDWSDTENNRLLFEMAAKYGIPYFSNYVNSDMKPGDVRSMCCRLRLDLRELRKRNGGFFGAGESTGCYDDKTYVFTNNGWKLFKDLDDNDEVCTLSASNEIEYHKPDKKFVYDYSGDMIKIAGDKINLLVTPNHRMLYCDRYTDEHKFVRADSITRENYKIPASGHWTGKDSEYFILPGIHKEFITGNHHSQHNIDWDPVKIKMTSWLKFLGMFLSEGSYDNDNCAESHGYRVFITQIKKDTKAIFENALKELPFNYRYDGRSFVICNKQLWSYIKQFGHCYYKYIPDDIKALPGDKLRILYDYLMYGDGNTRAKTGCVSLNAIHQKVYYTSSERLANDVREILIKIGCMSSINTRQGRIATIRGRKIVSTAIQYEICAYQTKNRYLTPRNIGKEAYTGKVYCCEVKNNTLLVKRNEKMCWCGNSIGVVTINMPRIGYLAADKDDFYARLDHMMDIAARSLEIKRKTITDLYNRGLYPYTKRYLGETAFHNHFSTIGLVGMNEACLNAKWLKDDLTHKDAQDFTVDVLNHMRNRLSDYQEQYPGTLFNLEATPAESTCVSGDTNVWTDKGRMTVNDIVADKNKNIGILSYNAETKSVEFKKLVDCWKTKKDAEVMRITFSNGDSVKVTPNHKMAKRFMTGRGSNRKCWIDYVEAGSLKVGDRLFACHVFTKSSEAAGETYQNVECRLGKDGGNFPMHRMLAEYYYGKIPEGFVVHHKDFDKTNNAKDNLEIMSDADHRRLHEHDEGRNFVRCIDGSANPFFGKHHTDESKALISETKKETKGDWYPKFLESMASEDTRKKMSEGNKKKSFEQYSRYMPECSTDAIVAKWKENKSIGEIAKELGEPYTYSLVKSRLKHAGLLPNHQIVKIEYLTEREDVYDLEVEGNHNFFISGGVDDAVLVHNCFRLAKHDKEMYPDIITAGKSGETPYYTNSSHLPVGYTDDMFSALDVEDRFQTLYTSGTVFHAFLGQRLPDWHSCMRLVRKIAENYKLPYFTMSPTYSICPDHGYIVGEKWKCPICGKETEVYSRITGYYRPLKNWNAGKMQEFHDRKEYDSSKEEVHDGCNACSLENKNISSEAPKVDHLMLFTNPTCPNCKMAKMLLDKAGIKYDNIDASTHLDQVNAFGITAAPTMIVPDGASFDVYRNASEIAGWIKSRANA